MNLDALDGTIGQGWGGLAPNGSHVNVVLARRGSPTAAPQVIVWSGSSSAVDLFIISVGGQTGS